MPPGWEADDKLTMPPGGGPVRLRTRLTGPNGESGMIVRSFDGHTLCLEKAYKSTLPTRITGVPGLEQPVQTINYLSARACRILGVDRHNLRQIKISRLQHRPTLMHLDWLMRRHPEQDPAALIGYTTWAKSYVRSCAGIVGHRLAPEPAIDAQGSAAWIQAHPGARRRPWSYLQHETERLTIKHLTGRKIARVDDPDMDWRLSATHALLDYKMTQRAGLGIEEANRRMKEIDHLLGGRLDAIDAEEARLRQRYDMPPDHEPAFFNFDVTFRTAPITNQPPDT